MQLETPVKDRTNTLTTTGESARSTTGGNCYGGGGGGDTTFLPELHSTPPMPTFQKPTVVAVDSSPGSPRSELARTGTGGRRENDTPALARRGRVKSEAVAPSTHSAEDRYYLKAPATTRSLPTSLHNHPEETIPAAGPLPTNWLAQHDRAICLLDVRGYPLPTIVLKMRRTFPSLLGVLTVGMVDRRLRQLDQIVEVDYWRVGLLGAKKSGFLGGSDMKVGESSGGRGRSGRFPGRGRERVMSGMTVNGEHEEIVSPMPVRAVEPTVRATTSGSLVQAQSVSNLLPDTISFSSARLR
ncbi:hypothetical protein LTR86_000516 [Recurvomyces mirabilis]|nr:hypothetical protein LTR86_000516 [Recurvomyces mirabilis]